ncbi:MAG: AbrB/MazE/SpoVT family DNA-binding domain-containing protein [Planctomycetota bacterium]
MPTAKVSSKGRIVIPKVIRETAGLAPGDQVAFIVQDNGDVVLRPVKRDVRRLKGILHRPGRKPVSVEEMNQVVQQRGRNP